MNIFNRVSQNYLFRNAGITAGLVGAGAVSGLTLDALILLAFGVGFQTDAFFTALTIPTPRNLAYIIRDGIVPREGERSRGWLSVDPLDGRVGVSFYSCADDSANARAHMMLALSSDGGASFPNHSLASTPADESCYDPNRDEGWGAVVALVAIDRDGAIGIPAICDLAEKEGIAMRGHCIFWGVPNHVQSWLKEMNDDDFKATVAQRGRKRVTGGGLRIAAHVARPRSCALTPFQPPS